MVTVMVMVMVFMADTDMVDTDMVDTAVDTDTDTTLAKDPLMLMLKPAQLCSMVPMDTHIITESTHTLMPHSDQPVHPATNTSAPQLPPMESTNCTSVKPKLMLPQTHTTAMPDTVMVMVMDTHDQYTVMAVTTEPEPTDTVVMADTDTVMAVN